ncbi:hypothetical protein D9M70_635930 [compost metagenome]
MLGGHHPHRHLGEVGAAGLATAGEGLGEAALAEAFEEARHDAAGDVHPAQRANGHRRVAGNPRQPQEEVFEHLVRIGIAGHRQFADLCRAGALRLHAVNAAADAIEIFQAASA